MSRPPFNMLRAVFWLLAIIMTIEMAMTVAAGTGCFYLILIGSYQLGACENVTAQIREVWAEALAAVLALLLASRPGPPSTPEHDC